MCGRPQIHATVRSRPSPKPECTNVPYFRRSRYQPYASTGKSFFADPVQQLVVVVLALRAADDLAVAFGRETVVAEHRARIVRILLHVERLRFLRIVHHEDRTVVILDEQRLVFGAQVVAPLHRAPLPLERS